MKRVRGQYVLETRNVRFRYPDGCLALDGCSLAIRPGSRAALLGANGAGKTTLAMLFNGLLKPESGEVLFNGAPIDHGRAALARLRAAVGIVFQNPETQLFSASVREDVSFGPVNLGLSRGETLERVNEALALVEMAASAEKPVHALSFGEKKRVCIAGVLAMRPEVIVMDEPTVGLDAHSKEGLLRVLGGLHRRGVTVVMATHDVDLAYAWADSAFLLQGGRLALAAGGENPLNDFLALERHGIGVPMVAEFYANLLRRGLVPEDAAPPRTKGELYELLDALFAGAPPGRREGNI